MSRLTCSLVLVGLIAGSALAMQPGTAMIVPAAARGGGVGGSLWVTSLYLLNPSSTSVDVSIAWLVRDQANPSPQAVIRTLAAESTLVVDDAITDLFQLTSGSGAFLVTAPQPVVVVAAILNRAGGEEFGQGFEGIPVNLAITAGRTTHAVGIAHNAEYRTNLFAVDAAGEGSTVVVDVLDTEGQVVGSRSYSLEGYEPILRPLSEVVSTPVDAGAVRFRVETGAVLVGTSRVNQATGDPLTLASWWECGSAGGDGLAPPSLAGLELQLTVSPNECGGPPPPQDVHVVVVSETEATINVYGQDQTIPIASYTAGGDLAYIETSLPDWGITDTWVTMVWATDSAGRFTGAATDFNGTPIQFSGTFEVGAR